MRGNIHAEKVVIEKGSTARVDYLWFRYRQVYYQSVDHEYDPWYDSDPVSRVQTRVSLARGSTVVISYLLKYWSKYFNQVLTKVRNWSKYLIKVPRVQIVIHATPEHSTIFKLFKSRWVPGLHSCWEDSVGICKSSVGWHRRRDVQLISQEIDAASRLFCADSADLVKSYL